MMVLYPLNRRIIMARMNRGAITDEALDTLLKEQKKVKNVREWRQMEAIWLREKLHLSGPQVAQILNYRLQTIHFLWHRWRRQGMEIFTVKKPPGGRNNAYMPRQEEEEFLRPFTERAPSGGIVEVQEIHKAFEARVGERVPKSTIYRLLHRHGWRKIIPRKKHPKSDPLAQEEVKKTHPSGT
jgi:transposase